MNPTQRAMHAYGQASETQPGLRQLVLLYDGAMRWVREARAALEEGRVADRYHAVSRAVAIIEGLQSSLDFERGGEIAANLDRLYTDLGFRLHRLNLGGEAAICDEALTRLGTLREAWAELAGRGAAPAAPAGQPQPAGRTAGLTI